MTASVDLVKELRERTGAGIMDCKTALKETSGDLEKATDFLRKKGLASAAKRAGREAKEGIVAAKISGRRAVLVEANCETDFVARTDDFKALANLAIDEVLAQGPNGIDSERLQTRLAELSGKIGEKMLVRRAEVVDSDQALFSYIHSNGKLGVVVELASGKAETRSNADFAELGKNLAMQVAASNPICVDRAQVPAETLEREKAVYREEVKGKPENILEKIVQGKLEKFYQTACLVEQPFIKDDKTSVKQLLADAGKRLGDTIQLKRFVRFQLGEKAPSAG
jgi:elongation factor Ts